MFGALSISSQITQVKHQRHLLKAQKDTLRTLNTLSAELKWPTSSIRGISLPSSTDKVLFFFFILLFLFLFFKINILMIYILLGKYFTKNITSTIMGWSFNSYVRSKYLHFHLHFVFCFL